MKKLNEEMVKEMMLQEIEDYMELNGIDTSELIDNEDLAVALEDFQSEIFVEYMEQENKALLWDIKFIAYQVPEISIWEA